MKLKYIKEFNESNDGPELSFDDFKNIMLDLADQFEFEYDFHDYSNDPDNPFYDFWIYMTVKEGYELHDDIPDMNFDYLNWDTNQLISPESEPEELNNQQFTEIIGYIDGNRDDLESLKNDLDNIIERNKKAKLVFEIVRDKIIPRFKKFSNLYQCGIGFNSGDLRITFEIKNE